MSFTEAEKRKWHADRRAERTDDQAARHVTACSHCGIAIDTSHAGSEFPLCDACDGD